MDNLIDFAVNALKEAPDEETRKKILMDVEKEAGANTRLVFWKLVLELCPKK